MSDRTSEPLWGRWRQLRAKEFAGQWGVELKNGDGYSDLSGQDIEIRRGDKSVARKRLAKLICRRNGKLGALYAVESISKNKENDENDER